MEPVVEAAHIIKEGLDQIAAGLSFLGRVIKEAIDGAEAEENE